MKTQLARAGALVLALAVMGCGRGPSPDAVRAPEDTDTRLGEAIEIKLDAWLRLPRKELDRLGAEWGATIRTQQAAARSAPHLVELLPDLHPPLVWPIFHEARYSPEADLTLPAPYDAALGPAVALHLARFGDQDAALRLTPSEDKATRSRIDTLKGERNYPVEWTRLVARVQYAAQLKLATGDPAGATELVLLHHQLTKILCPKAKAGPLGAWLLTSGRRALELAAAAWRDPKRNKTALAADIDRALKEWFSSKSPVLDVPLGRTRDELAGALGNSSSRAVVTSQPAEMARVLDLLAVPVPRESAQVVVAFFDAKQRLAELLVGYGGKLDTIYPRPHHLGYAFAERGLSPGGVIAGASLQRQEWSGGEVVCQVYRSDRSTGLAGLVRLVRGAGKTVPLDARSPRDLGIVHLDRGFEATRAELAPDQAGPVLTIKNAAKLGDLARSLNVPAPTSGLVEREKESGAVVSVRFSWSAEQTTRALGQLLPGLWATFGSAMPTGVEDPAGSYLALNWQADHARLQLRLPFNETGAVLIGEDTRTKGQLPARAEAVRKRDAEERLARLRAAKPRITLERTPGKVNGLSLDRLKLGQARVDAEAVLPSGTGYRKHVWPGGLRIVVLTPTPQGASRWARQLTVLFSPDDKVREVRVRYFETAGAKRSEPDIPAGGGAPEALPSSWQGVWADLPGSVAAIHQRWQDDLTVRTYQRDPWGAEVVLRDRPLDDALSPPLLDVGRGVKGAQLGATPKDIQASLKSPARIENEAEVYAQPANSPYEAVFVWYARGRASRILALHRDKVKPAEAPRALQAAWGKHLDQRGYVRRQEGPQEGELGALYWFDDRVRVKTFALLPEKAKEARLYTEWRTWPVR